MLQIQQAGQSPCNGFPSNGLHMVNGPSNHYAPI